VLVSFGDCAVTGNVSALRNPIPVDAVVRTSYAERVTLQPRSEHDAGIVPRLLARAVPLHRYVAVDVYLPGCPPSADLIWSAVHDILAGRQPIPEGAPAPKFG
jgi:NAD-reducing hydrogenase small subunit